MLKVAANVNLTYVPYPSEIPAVNALLGGRVTSMLGSFRAVASYLRIGTLRAVAVTSRNRIEPLPEVSTVAESGYKDYEAEASLVVVRSGANAKGSYPAAFFISEAFGTLARAHRCPTIDATPLATGLVRFWWSRESEDAVFSHFRFKISLWILLALATTILACPTKADPSAAGESALQSEIRGIRDHIQRRSEHQTRSQPSGHLHVHFSPLERRAPYHWCGAKTADSCRLLTDPEIRTSRAQQPRMNAVHRSQR
jgi:Tripartite tricarboxylate transporter family receptor